MQALLTDVHLLILDEPLSGLDRTLSKIRTYFTLIKTTRYIYTLHMSRKTATRKLRRQNCDVSKSYNHRKYLCTKGAEQVYIEAIVHETFSAIELQNNPVLYTLHTIQIKTLFNYKSKKNIQTKCFSFYCIKSIYHTATT